jgi:hypothetical protein
LLPSYCAHVAALAFEGIDPPPAPGSTLPSLVEHERIKKPLWGTPK